MKSLANSAFVWRSLRSDDAKLGMPSYAILHPKLIQITYGYSNSFIRKNFPKIVSLSALPQ